MPTQYKVVFNEDPGIMFQELQEQLLLGWNLDYAPSQIGSMYWCKLYKEMPATASERNRAYRPSRPLPDQLSSHPAVRG